MQVNRRFLAALPEIVIVTVNAFLGLSFYVIEQNFSRSKFLKVDYTSLSETAFVIGAGLTFLVFLLRWKLARPVVRLSLLVALTLFNQACLIAFLVSVMPYRW